MVIIVLTIVIVSIECKLSKPIAAKSEGLVTQLELLERVAYCVCCYIELYISNGDYPLSRKYRRCHRFSELSEQLNCLVWQLNRALARQLCKSVLQKILQCLLILPLFLAYLDQGFLNQPNPTIQPVV